MASVFTGSFYFRVVLAENSKSEKREVKYGILQT